MNTNKIIELCKQDDKLYITTNYCEKLLKEDVCDRYETLMITAPFLSQTIDLSLYPELRPAIVRILEYVVKCTNTKRKDLRIEVSRLAMEGL